MKINSDYPINKDILIDISEMLKDYDFIVSKRFIKDRVKDFLKDSTPKKCRFCGKSFPDVTFNTEAHSIPEFLGNKSLISLCQCYKPALPSGRYLGALQRRYRVANPDLIGIVESLIRVKCR